MFLFLTKKEPRRGAPTPRLLAAGAEKTYYWTVPHFWCSSSPGLYLLVQPRYSLLNENVLDLL